MSVKNQLLIVLAFAVTVLAIAPEASATHWRFGQVTWTRVSGLEVEITVQEGYESGFIGANTYSLGDGGTLSTSGASIIATGLDVDGESWTLLETVATHTYPNEGPFLVTFDSCCRISELINAGDASQQVQAVIDLHDGNLGSPVSSVLPVVQMQIDVLNSIPLPIADPDLDPFTVRMATAAESLIPSVAMGTFPLTVNSVGVLEWDTTGTATGNKYAVQVIIDEFGSGVVGPPNDNFVDSTDLMGIGGQTGGSNSGATGETDEPILSSPINSVWWSWTSPVSGSMVFDTNGSDFDTVLGIFTGASVDALATIGSDDDSGVGAASLVMFTATMGETYHIAVDGFGTFTGSIALNWAPPPVVTSGENDDFANRTVIVGAHGNGSGTNVGATFETGEIALSSTPQSVWWSWTSPFTGPITFDTNGSALDTVIGIFTGTSVDTLSLIDSDDQGGVGNASLVTFAATMGETYQIAVDGWSSLTGTFVLNWGINISPTGAGLNARTALDFIVEIVAGPPPTCAIDGPTENFVKVNETISIAVTGTDPGDQDLTVSHLGLPAGSTLTPVSGTTSASPFEAVFEWTPTIAEVNTSHAITIRFTDPDNLVGTCGFTVTVTDDPLITIIDEGEDELMPLIHECGIPYMDPGATATDFEGTPIDVTATVMVDNHTPGDYTVLYEATDAFGNMSSKVRHVQVVDTMPPMMMLNEPNANPLVVECGSEFVDPGAMASDVCAGNLTGSIMVTGVVDTSTPGMYMISYYVEDPTGNSTSMDRAVTVEDTSPPNIMLLGANPLLLNVDDPFSDPGATASDTCDGDLTGAIMADCSSVDTSMAGTYMCVYSVTDSANHTTMVERTVEVMDCNVTLMLNGNDTVTVECGSDFVDPGATAEDCLGASIQVVVDCVVDTSTPGMYMCTYTATDSQGMMTSVSRTVNVVDTTPPMIALVGADPLVLMQGDTFVDPGATASDTCAGDLTGSIVADCTAVDTNTPGDYTCFYTVDDGSDNMASVQRTVTVNSSDPGGDPEGCAIEAIILAEWPSYLSYVGALPHHGSNGDHKIPQIWGLHAILRVLCDPEHPLHDETWESFDVNYATLGTEDSMVLVEIADFQHVLAALLEVGNGRMHLLIDLFGLGNEYQTVVRPPTNGNPHAVLLADEPFADTGDMDYDGLTNGDEYDVVTAQGGGMEEWLDAMFAGLPAMPIGSMLGMSLLAALLAACGLVLIRKEPARQR